MNNTLNNKAKKPVPEKEYVFASAYLKAKDGKGTPAERLTRLKEARDAESIRALVADAYGVSGSDVFDAVIKQAVDNIKECAPDFSVFKPLLYKYDCTNIKTAIKCSIKDINPEGLLFTCGTIPCETVVEAASSADFSKIPGEMGRAAAEALEAYRKSGETRIIDLLLDKACFADMKTDADNGKVQLISDIVKARADGINLITSARISASGTVPELFERAYVPGGSIPVSAFYNAEGSLKDPSELRASFNKKSFEAAEKDVDTEIIKLCEKFRFKPFGAEVAVRYLVLIEMEMMNCRIATAALNSANREDVLRERLRVAYV